MTLETLCDEKEMKRIKEDSKKEAQYNLTLGEVMYKLMEEYLKEEIKRYKKIPVFVNGKEIKCP